MFYLIKRLPNLQVLADLLQQALRTVVLLDFLHAISTHLTISTTFCDRARDNSFRQCIVLQLHRPAMQYEQRSTIGLIYNCTLAIASGINTRLCF